MFGITHKPRTIESAEDPIEDLDAPAKTLSHVVGGDDDDHALSDNYEGGIPGKYKV
jgi:hypothetical protein